MLKLPCSSYINSPPFSCGHPALWSGRPADFVLTSAVSVSAPLFPSPPDFSGNTSRKCDTNVKDKCHNFISGVYFSESHFYSNDRKSAQVLQPSPCQPAVHCSLFWSVGFLALAWFWSDSAAGPKPDGNSEAGQVPMYSIMIHTFTNR